MVTQSVLAAPLPPLVQGLPILGNMREMANDIIALCVEQYKIHGPIFRLRALNREMVVLAGTEANIFVTQEGADKFSSKETWEPMGRELDSPVYMQSVDGEASTRFRKLMKRSYSASMMTSNLPLLVDIAQRAIDKMPVGTEMPAITFFRLMVTEQLGQMLTGHSVGDDLETITHFISTGLKVYVNQTMPSIVLRLPAYQKAKKRTIELGREIIAEHLRTTRNEPDLVDDVLAAREGHPDLFGTEGQLIQSVVGPFIAGLDTVSNECTFLLYSLVNHPEVLSRCVEEADALFAEGVPQADQLRSLEVIHHAMMETMRLHSIAPGITRNAAKPFVFAGHQVNEGQMIFLATTVAHYLPENFPNPYEFDVERFSPPRNEHKKRGAFSPFGIGTHTCLGAGAAEMQMMLVIATVLHTLKLDSPDKGKTIKIVNDPTPTLGPRFRVKIVERRNRIAVN